MKHVRIIGITPRYAEGLCENIVGERQAFFCFLLSFLRDVLVPLVQPFIALKTGQDLDEF
jgi:hypothetical protein